MSNRYGYGLKQDHDMFARIPQDYVFIMSGRKDYHCFYIYRRKLSKEELKSSGLVAGEGITAENVCAMKIIKDIVDDAICLYFKEEKEYQKLKERFGK